MYRRLVQMKYKVTSAGPGGAVLEACVELVVPEGDININSQAKYCTDLSSNLSGLSARSLSMSGIGR